MNPVVVIPTFVSTRSQREGGSIITTYDHPTPLSQEGDLPRCLESLTKVEGIGQIIVLVAAEPSIAHKAAQKTQAIAARFPELHIAVIGAAEAGLVRQRMEQLGLGKLTREVGLSGYGAVRNLGLVVACALGFDAVVFLDDDEVVTDVDFLRRAMYGLGKLTRKGIREDGFLLQFGRLLSVKELEQVVQPLLAAGKRVQQMDRAGHECAAPFAFEPRVRRVPRASQGGVQAPVVRPVDPAR